MSDEREWGEYVGIIRVDKDDLSPTGWSAGFLFHENAEQMLARLGVGRHLVYIDEDNRLHTAPEPTSEGPGDELCCCICENPVHRPSSHGETCARCGKHRPPGGEVNWIDEDATPEERKTFRNPGPCERHGAKGCVSCCEQVPVPEGEVVGYELRFGCGCSTIRRRGRYVVDETTCLVHECSPPEGVLQEINELVRRHSRTDLSEEDHREGTCELCSGEYQTWSADSELWNEVMRGGDPAAKDEYQFVCPTCFMNEAAKCGAEKLFYLTRHELRR